MQDRSKITDYASKNRVIYGRSDASLTAEAAMVLPFVLMLMLAFLLWIRFFRQQENSMRELNDQLRQISSISVIGPENGELLWTSEGNLPREIILTDVQTLRFPLGFVSVEKSFVRQAGLRVFSGRRYTDNSTGHVQEDKEERQVYVTETGGVYHAEEDCTHLMLSIKRIEYSMLSQERNQSGAIYYPCEVCMKSGVSSGEGNIYITEDGNRCHSDLGCRSLIRRISTVTLPVAEEQGRRPCSRCTGGE